VNTPRPISGIRAILFDLWNTLVYSDYSPNPMILIARALGIEQDPGWRKRIERGMMLRRHLGIREGLEALERSTRRSISERDRAALIRSWNEACAATKPYEDVPAAIESLSRRCRLGLVSNTQSFDLEFLRGPELRSRLDAVCLSCDQGRLKPDPAIFLAAARELNVPPGAVLMVGDNATDDVAGAAAAGMRALHLDRAGTAAGTAPEAAGTIRSLTEISAWLA